ncbi:MAG TPA: glycolate oxidase subunit GlcF [Burkholderiales bacterium]|nr:glycolate oxidase subunit GlcF [Burkholderiales bacterium]
MKTNLADFIRDTPEGREANAILRACVHCGFCTATCPTYQLLGEELDGPRGRIYLMKELFEGGKVSDKTQLHLDRCLTCRSCETTCPSGVRYGRLVDIGRNVVDKRVGRGFAQKMWRSTLKTVIPNSALFNPLLRLGQISRPVLPKALARKVPPRLKPTAWPAARHSRRMLVLQGCVQPGIAPTINPAMARVLDRIGISLIAERNAGCCGAVAYHLDAQEDGLAAMRRNVDAWWPYVEQGVEAIVMTASGCGVMVKEYAELLERDPRYGAKAKRISELTKDAGEILCAQRESLEALLKRPAPVENRQPRARRVAFHSPCTLQHGQQIRGLVEPLLSDAGWQLAPVPDAHLCCGSAGTYSILQPALSRRLLVNKVAALESGSPQVIATANIGCLAHIQTGTELPVRHWVELLDDALE